MRAVAQLRPRPVREWQTVPHFNVDDDVDKECLGAIHETSVSGWRELTN